MKITTILINIYTQYYLILNISNNSYTIIYTFITKTNTYTLPKTIYTIITTTHYHNIISLIILISIIKSILHQKKKFNLLIF